MPKGISLHVGINKVSSAFPSAAELKGCENDAIEMEKIAIAKNFAVHDRLLGCEATYARVTTKIRNAAAQLEKDDIFLFTFAGHGYQHSEIGPDRDELDHSDETILLFDVELFDDVLRKELWPCFKPGVRILMIADSCHSGSVFAAPGDGEESVSTDNAIATPYSSTMDDFPVATGNRNVRTIEDFTARQHQIEYGEFYRSTLRLPIYNSIHASLLLLAACSDHQETADGDPNGAYTDAMLEVLRDDPEDYDDLVGKMQLKFTGAQTLKITDGGQIDPNFRKQKPFTV